MNNHSGTHILNFALRQVHFAINKFLILNPIVDLTPAPPATYSSKLIGSLSRENSNLRRSSNTSSCAILLSNCYLFGRLSIPFKCLPV